jgi:predicted RNA-binding protein with TRAM domain
MDEAPSSPSETPQQRRLPRSYFKPKPVKVGDELELEISEISRRGDGLARVQGYVVFVPNTKQGDKVKVRISQIRPSFAVGEVIRPQ